MSGRESNSSSIIKQPKAHKAQIQLWKDVSYANAEKIVGSTNAAEKRTILASINGLIDSFDTNPRDVITLDLLSNVTKFSDSLNFGIEQYSTLISITLRIHEAMMETPFGNLEHCFEYLRNLLVAHSVRRPPFGIDLFSSSEVRAISDFFTETYFENFKLYKYAFTPDVQLDLCFTYDGEVPPSPEASETSAALGVLDEADAKDVNEADVDESGQDSAALANKTLEVFETEEMKQLREIIEEYFRSEIDQVRGKLEDSIKRSEEELSRKIDERDQKDGRKSGKGRKR